MRFSISSQIFRREWLVALEIVVKAIFDGRTDGHLGAGKQTLHRLRHQMRGRVAQNIETIGAFRRDPIHDAIFFDSPIQIDGLAVDLGGDQILGAGGSRPARPPECQGERRRTCRQQM